MRSLLLRPVSWLYGAAVWIRGRCYDLGVLGSAAMSVPVISVGNMSAGGTGKTPLVEYLVNMLLEEKMRVAVVSRGYRRATRGLYVVSDGSVLSGSSLDSGDEPYQIARKFPRAVVIVDERKARAAAAAVRDHKADAVIVDDGFQHRALGRDLDIVTVDSTKPLRAMALLPSGLRRDVMRSMTRAGVIVHSRCALGAHDHERFEEAVGALECCVRSVPRRCIPLNGAPEIAVPALAGTKVVAFCAVGDPGSFRRTLEEAGCTVVEFLAYPDHHAFTAADLETIRASVEARLPDHVLTTEKDAVRILGAQGLAPLMAPNAAYLEIACSFIRGEEDFRKLIRSTVRRRAA